MPKILLLIYMSSQKDEIPGWFSGQFVLSMFCEVRTIFCGISACQQTLLKGFVTFLQAVFHKIERSRVSQPLLYFQSIADKKLPSAANKKQRVCVSGKPAFRVHILLFLLLCNILV